ncbi:MAG: HK97 gp10 family phage protein [Cyanobacteria bacterium P01_H01_bin.130]
MFRVALKGNPGAVQKDVAKQVRDRILDAGLELAEELQRNSPVGATGALRRGWSVTQPRKSTAGFSVGMSIVNETPDALQRIAGSPPGTNADLKSLTQWVKAKGIARGTAARWVAVRIRRNIYERGTGRWRDGGNQQLGIGRRGEALKGGVVDRAVERLAEEISRMKIK